MYNNNKCYPLIFSILARLSYQAIGQQQEEAGSLANFCPSVVVYSDSPANETVDCEVKWQDDEEENVISVCEFLKFSPTALQLNIERFIKPSMGNLTKRLQRCFPFISLNEPKTNSL